MKAFQKFLIANRIQTLFPLLDILVTIISYFTAYYLTNLFEKEYFVFTIDYVYMLLLIIPTWAILLRNSNLASIPRTRTPLSIFFNLLNFNFAGFLMIFLFKHLFKLDIFSHYMIISFSVINMISLFILRMLTYRVFKYFRVNGHNIHNVIIYADENSAKFISDILVHKEWGFRILMVISDSETIRERFGKEMRILPDKIKIIPSDLETGNICSGDLKSRELGHLIRKEFFLNVPGRF